MNKFSFLKFTIISLSLFSMIILNLFVMFLIASIGHDLDASPGEAYFYVEDVIISPDIDCLKIGNAGAQTFGGEIKFINNCNTSIFVNNKELKYLYLLNVNNENVFTEINNLSLVANSSNNYTLTFFIEKDNISSIVNVPVLIGKSNLHIWIIALLLIHLPLIFLLVISFIYIRKSNELITKKDLSLIFGLISVIFYIVPLIPVIFGLLGIFFSYGKIRTSRKVFIGQIFSLVALISHSVIYFFDLIILISLFLK